ncbi:MAG: proline dehydrogenase family protein [Vicinamibacterales bacterium]
MLDNASKAFFHLLAKSGTLKTVTSHYGMRRPTSFARRFIAGETVEEAIEAARAVEGRGLTQTLDLLGEGVRTLDEAQAASRDYLTVIDAILTAGIGRNLSLKLTQLGLEVDRAIATDNLRRILDHAEGFFVRIDMESSAFTAATLRVFETVWDQGYRQLGVVLQSDLKRTAADVERMIELGARVRLVKGAYREPAAVAFQHKVEVDENYRRLLERLLSAGHYPAIATHDPTIIEHAQRFSAERGIARTAFEFQMLYGIRRDLQTQLVADGFGVRVYIPFGRHWFPYFMRRLGERPANIGFVLRGIARDRT